MYDRSLVLEQIAQAEEAIRRIERRFQGITAPDDFVSNDEGLDRLDAIAMMLIAIGESIKKIDKITSGKLLEAFPEIHWPGVKGTRDILAHDYFDIDQDEIYNICVNDLGPLKKALQKMREEI
ncbi:MAG: DUF86 domain-containing protein [Deltaproteobacteria bacterium]|nr:DUF86 domain-containing protein [Deltaproteobacteria bacterium]